MTYYLSSLCIILFGINLWLYFFYKKISIYYNLIDVVNDSRKIHIESTPRSGGLFFWLTITVLFIFEIINIYYNHYEFSLFGDIRSLLSFYLISSLIFFIGLYDDRYDLGPNKKLIYTTVSIFLCLNIDSSLVINELRFSLIDYQINLESFGLYFTILCFLLLINAINMFDGINLQVGIYILSLFFFFLINSISIPLILVLLFPLLFYLKLNSKGKIFLGDCGSLLLGILIGYIIIKSYNSGKLIYCDDIFLMLAVPGIDMLRLSILRIIKGKNMFNPDRNHIHHILLDKYNFKVALSLIVSLNLLVFIFLYFDVNNIIIFSLLIIIYLFLINKRKVKF